MYCDLGGFVFSDWGGWGASKKKLTSSCYISDKILFARIYHLKVVIQYISLLRISWSQKEQAL